jgi:hypothetical protein
MGLNAETVGGGRDSPRSSAAGHVAHKSLTTAVLVLPVAGLVISSFCASYGMATSGIPPDPAKNGVDPTLPQRDPPSQSD